MWMDKDVKPDERYTFEISSVCGWISSFNEGCRAVPVKRTDVAVQIFEMTSSFFPEPPL